MKSIQHPFGKAWGSSSTTAEQPYNNIAEDARDAHGVADDQRQALKRLMDGLLEQLGETEAKLAEARPRQSGGLTVVPPHPTGGSRHLLDAVPR